MASYEKASNGTWSVRFRAFENGDEKNKRLSGFQTKKEAQAAFVEYMKGYIPPETKPTQLTFGQVAEKYLEYVEAMRKESSYVALANALHSHILPVFGDKRLDKIKAPDLEAFQIEALQKGFRKNTVRQFLTIFSTVWNFAIKRFDAPPNPRLKISAIKGDTDSKIHVWSIEQCRKFLDAAPPGRDRTMFEVLLYTGMRYGECAALTWEDIDFEKNTITISKTISWVLKNRGAASHGKNFKVTPPKTWKSRMVKIPQPLADSLDRYYKEKNSPPRDQFVFATRSCGGPMHRSTVQDIFDLATQKAGLPKIRIHDLRHTHASLLLSAGVSIVAVSNRLGHANVATTLKTYAHIMPSDEDRIIMTLSKLGL